MFVCFSLKQITNEEYISRFIIMLKYRSQIHILPFLRSLKTTQLYTHVSRVVHDNDSWASCILSYFNLEQNALPSNSFPFVRVLLYRSRRKASHEDDAVTSTTVAEQDEQQNRSILSPKHCREPDWSKQATISFYFLFLKNTSHSPVKDKVKPNGESSVLTEEVSFQLSLEYRQGFGVLSGAPDRRTYTLGAK